MTRKFFIFHIANYVINFETRKSQGLFFYILFPFRASEFHFRFYNTKKLFINQQLGETYLLQKDAKKGLNFIVSFFRKLANYVPDCTKIQWKAETWLNIV